jgi:hypothetical protein
MLKRLFMIVNLVALLGCIKVVFSQEEIAITTYYPSPYGVYSELRSQRIAIGDNYSTSDYCWQGWPTCANDIDDDASLVIEGNVGIGTVSPFRKLTISGNNDVHIGFDSTADTGRRMTILWDNQVSPNLPGQLVFFDDTDGGTIPFRFDFVNDSFIVNCK